MGIMRVLRIMVSGVFMGNPHVKPRGTNTGNRWGRDLKKSGSACFCFLPPVLDRR